MKQLTESSYFFSRVLSLPVSGGGGFCRWIDLELVSKAGSVTKWVSWRFLSPLLLNFAFGSNWMMLMSLVLRTLPRVQRLLLLLLRNLARVQILIVNLLSFSRATEIVELSHIQTHKNGQTDGQTHTHRVIVRKIRYDEKEESSSSSPFRISFVIKIAAWHGGKNLWNHARASFFFSPFTHLYFTHRSLSLFLRREKCFRATRQNPLSLHPPASCTVQFKHTRHYYLPTYRMNLPKVLSSSIPPPEAKCKKHSHTPDGNCVPPGPTALTLTQ